MLEEMRPRRSAALDVRASAPPLGRSRAGAFAAGLIVLVAVTSCGSDATPEATTADTTATTSTTSTPASTVEVDGAAPDPAALSDFACAVDRRGRWNAVGRITNTSGSTADFVVTVVVAGEETTSADGLRQRVAQLADGDSVELELSRLPVEATSGLTCRVQVLRRS